MKRQFLIRLSLCCIAITGLSLFAAIGCNSTDRTDGPADREAKADHMTEDDTARAEAILDEQKNENQRGAKPAVGRQRDGTRVVDQPRVGRP